MPPSPPDLGPDTGGRATTEVELVSPVPDGGTTSTGGSTSGGGSDDHAEDQNIRSQQDDPDPPPDSAFNPVVRSGRFVLEKALPADGAWYRIRNFQDGEVLRGPTSDRLTQQDLLLAVDQWRIRNEQHATQGDDPADVRRQAESGERSEPVDGDPQAPGGEAHPTRNPGAAAGATVQAASAGGGAGDAPFTLIVLVGGAVLLLTWRMTAE